MRLIEVKQRPGKVAARSEIRRLIALRWSSE